MSRGNSDLGQLDRAVPFCEDSLRTCLVGLNVLSWLQKENMVEENMVEPVNDCLQKGFSSQFEGFFRINLSCFPSKAPLFLEGVAGPRVGTWLAPTPRRPWGLEILMG